MCLPLSLSVVDRPSSDIIERLTEKRSKKHKEALKQLNRELTELTQVEYILLYYIQASTHTDIHEIRYTLI